MIFLDKKEKEKFEKYIDAELVRRWEGFENRTNQVVTIANTGLYSSGKSSLFNALIDRTSDERFPVGAIPTTKSGDKEKFSESIEIIDTPGIDANVDDDAVAISMLTEADIILMTHNAKMGMLNKSEYDWLSSIASKIPVEDVKTRIIFVCTWVDEIEASDKENVITEIKRQLYEILNQDISIWEVSSKRYYIGTNKNKDKLIEASNIPKFREFLINKANEYLLLKSDIQNRERVALCETTRKLLEDRKITLESAYNEKKKKIDKKYSPKRNSWSSILSNFNEMKAGVKKKLKLLKDENYHNYNSFERDIKNM